MQKSGIETIIFMVKEGPFSGTSPYAAVKMAISVRKRGVKCGVFYYSEGILCLKKGAAEKNETFYEYGLKVKKMQKEGIKILACKASADLHGIDRKELLKGVEIVESITSYIIDEKTRIITL